MKATIKTTDFKKRLSVYKREAARGVKYSSSDASKKFSILYRNALNSVKNELQLEDLFSYKRTFWNAFKIEDVKTMNAIYENINFEFID
jgi:hypothetical protein